MGEKKKTRSTTSTAVKQRWLDKNMTAINVRQPTKLAEAFKVRVAERGDTIAALIRDMMIRYLEETDSATRGDDDVD